MRKYSLFEFSLTELVRNRLDNPDDFYTPMHEVRDQLKCLGSDLTYWESIAHQLGGGLSVEDDKIVISLPDDFEFIDRRIWDPL